MEGYISYRLTMDLMDALTALTVRLHVDLRRQASALCPRRYPDAIRTRATHVAALSR